MDHLSIRPAKREDVGLIASMIGGLAEHVKLRHELKVDQELMAAWMFDEGKAEALLGFWKGEAVTYALFFHSFSTFLGRSGIYLEDIYVHPEFRRMGIGKAMMLALAKIARERGCARFEWSCLDNNEGSVAFYKALGAERLEGYTMHRLDERALCALTGDQKEHHPRLGGRRIVGYFCEWMPGGFQVKDIPWGTLTHLNYAFVHVGEDNQIAFADREAAIQRDMPGQDETLRYKGHFNLLQVHRRKAPWTKLMVSVGGWGGCSGFYTMCDHEEGRQIFAKSCVDFLQRYHFDGIDIDFEYPSAARGAGEAGEQALAEPRRNVIYPNFCAMMRILRKALDEAGEQDGRRYLLTFAAPASAWVLSGMGIGEFADTLDFVTLMGYDFKNAGQNITGSHAALYPNPIDPETKDLPMPTLNTDWAVRYFSGVLPSDKIVPGAPLYTVGWRGVTANADGSPLFGKAECGAEMMHLWQALRLSTQEGYELRRDETGGTPYIWGEKEGLFLCAEDKTSFTERIDYILRNRLGGLMIWELSGDFMRNEAGEYCQGYDLLTMVKERFARAGKLDSVELLSVFTVDTQGFRQDFVYENGYPQRKYHLTIYNDSSEPLDEGFVLELSLPASAVLETPENGLLLSSHPEGLFMRYTIKTRGGSLRQGESFTLKGVITLPFSGTPSRLRLRK